MSRNCVQGYEAMVTALKALNMVLLMLACTLGGVSYRDDWRDRMFLILSVGCLFVTSTACCCVCFGCISYTRLGRCGDVVYHILMSLLLLISCILFVAVEDPEWNRIIAFGFGISSAVTHGITSMQLCIREHYDASIDDDEYRPISPRARNVTVHVRHSVTPRILY